MIINIMVQRGDCVNAEKGRTDAVIYGSGMFWGGVPVLSEE